MLERQKQKQHHPIAKLVSAYGWDAQSAVPGLKINPYETLGESGHNVMTGTLYGESEAEVIVKPHVKVDRAQRESFVSQQVAKAGLNTPEPLGVYRGNEAAYLLFRRYPGLQTLTDLSLRTSIAHPSVRNSIQPRLARAGVALADLHNQGFIHKDYQARNVAEGPNGEPVYIDLEGTLYTSRANTESSRAEDLFKFSGSVLLMGYLGEKSPAYRASAISEAVTPYYKDSTDLLVDYDAFEAATAVVAQTGLMYPSIRKAIQKGVN